MMTKIKTEFISKAQAIYRRGIAGKTSKGICYRLYSKDDYENMKEDRLPEIMRTPPEISILRILGMGIKIENFSMIDKLDEKL